MGILILKGSKMNCSSNGFDPSGLKDGSFARWCGLSGLKDVPFL
jgi:hypothetical protein